MVSHFYGKCITWNLLYSKPELFYYSAQLNNFDESLHIWNESITTGDWFLINLLNKLNHNLLLFFSNCKLFRPIKKKFNTVMSQNNSNSNLKRPTNSIHINTLNFSLVVSLYWNSFSIAICWINIKYCVRTTTWQFIYYFDVCICVCRTYWIELNWIETNLPFFIDLLEWIRVSKRVNINIYLMLTVI